MRELTGGFARVMGAKRPITLANPPVERLVRDAKRREPAVRRSQLAHSRRAAARTENSAAAVTLSAGVIR
jgi:hypothetical protein